MTVSEPLAPAPPPSEWRWWPATYGLRLVAAIVCASGATILLVVAMWDIWGAGGVTGSTGPAERYAGEMGSALLFGWAAVLLLIGAPSGAAVLLFSHPTGRSIARALAAGPVLAGTLLLLAGAVWAPATFAAGLLVEGLSSLLFGPVAAALALLIFTATARLFGVLPARGASAAIRGVWRG